MKPLPVALLFLLLALPAFAQAPSTMSYQGVLTDNAGAIVPDGAYNLTFRIYDVPAAGAALWTEALAAVPIVRGGFGVTLGLATPIALAFDRTYYLGVQVGADPEMSPRVVLASSPYALSLRLPFSQTLSSGSALLTLRNSGAGKTLVADGAVDIGSTTNSGTLRLYRNGSASEVAKMGASADGGQLDLLDEAGAFMGGIEPDVDGNGAFFYLTRTGNAPALTVDGNYLGSGEPRMAMSGSTRAAVFDMGSAGNASVILPGDAVSASEVLDEPGIAHANLASTVMPSTSLGTLLSRTITCPAAGYVVAIGTTDLQVSHTTGTNSNWGIGISTNSTAMPTEQDFQVTLPSALPTGTYGQTLTAHGVFPVTAGANTFYLLGAKYSGSTSTAFDENLTLMFFPTSYGSVDAPSPQFAARSSNPNSERAMPTLDTTAIRSEQGEAERFHQARLERELNELRIRFEKLQGEIAATAAAQVRASAEPTR